MKRLMLLTFLLVMSMTRLNAVLHGGVRGTEFCGHIVSETCHRQWNYVRCLDGECMANASSINNNVRLNIKNSDSICGSGNANITQMVEYVPFGEVFVERRFGDSWASPYLFNAKEYDEETGLYYYGARYYDPRLSLWLSPDPLALEYPGVSAYCYTNNNPVKYIDPDGMDAVRVVNDETKSITIKADYYVVTEAFSYRDGNTVKSLNGYSEKDIQEMKKYNTDLNNLNLTVPSGEYKDYKIQFDLNFIDGGSSADAEILASNAEYDGHNIGNTIQVGNEKTHPRLNFNENTNDDGSTSAVGGVTGENYKIIMNQPYDTKKNRIHEIFHTFGFSHPKGTGGSQGIMRYPPANPSKLDALELSKTHFLPTIRK